MPSSSSTSSGRGIARASFPSLDFLFMPRHTPACQLLEDPIKDGQDQGYLQAALPTTRRPVADCGSVRRGHGGRLAPIIRAME